MRNKQDSPTQKYIDAIAAQIEKMDHYEMCIAWRFSPSGDYRFRKDLITSSGKNLGDIFHDRLFKHFSGFTVEISKAISWH